LILKTFDKILILIVLILFCIPQNSTAQDTLSVIQPVKRKFQPEPLRATMLAVAFPGLGQIYNRKYWKIPLVYLGFGGLIYSVGFNSSHYNTYMKAYQDFTDAIPETDSYLKLIPSTIEPASYDPVLHPESYQNYKDQMLRYVDYYRRYRDLSYIGIAGWYLFSILDANVDASLFNFDVSKNLDVAAFPVLMSSPGGFVGTGLNLKITF
jgi:hypothetical protein